MPTDSNYLGKYTSVAKVWEAYPSGGIEGNYVLIGAADEEGTRYNWNKYKRQWLNAAGIPETTAREMLEADGDVFIQNNLTVGGTLRAKRIKQPCLGLFLTEAALEAKWPEPEVGMWALVGEEFPATVYVCETNGEWTETEATAGPDDVDLSSIVINGIKGWVAIDSISELPSDPTEEQKSKGYLLGTTLYIWDSTEETFKSANIKGPKGDPGGQLEGYVTIVNDLTTGGATNVLSAEMGKTLAGMIGSKDDLNLLRDNIDYGYVVKSTNVSTSADNAVSGYIDISDGKSIIISKVSEIAGYYLYCAFYDANKSLLSVVNVGLVQGQPNAIITNNKYPTNAKYLRYNINMTEYNSADSKPYAYKWDDGINWADVNFRGFPTFYNTKDNILVDYPASIGYTRNYNNGVISASANNALCLIPVTANEKYIISPYSVSFQFVNASFAGVENFTDAINYDYYSKDWHNEGNIITAPSTAVYMYAIFSKADYEGGLCYMYKFSKRNVVDLPPLYKLERGIRSELYNKNVYILGDSFSSWSSTSTSDSYKWHVLLKRKYGWNMTINATNGRPIQIISTMGLAKDIDNLANLQTMPDVVIVWGGHNDVNGVYGDFNDIGTQDTSGAVATYANKNTLCGALRYICEVVHTLAPNAKLVFLTPMLTDHMKPSEMMADGTHQRWQIAVAIKEACQRYSATYISMQGAGYHQWNTVSGATGTWSDDGTHPNKLGYKNIADFLAKRLSAEIVEYNADFGGTAGTWWDYKETV